MLLEQLAYVDTGIAITRTLHRALIADAHDKSPKKVARTHGYACIVWQISIRRANITVVFASRSTGRRRHSIPLTMQCRSSSLLHRRCSTRHLCMHLHLFMHHRISTSVGSTCRCRATKWHRNLNT